MKVLSTQKDSMDFIKEVLTAKINTENDEIYNIVKNIIKDVKENKDKAVIALGQKFDSDKLTNLRVSKEEIDEAYTKIDSELLDAIKVAKNNIYNFHKKQMQDSWKSSQDGCTYGQIIRPIEKVGFYAPGGLAPYPSTVLMTAVPGLVAGVKTLVMCAPCQKDGNIHPAMLVAANECGVTDIFKAGGAQAVAAMAFGTESIPKVDKIVGPGNAFVAEAKRQLFGIVGIDQMAGPSEILVICDKYANPKYVAADVLSQAEHADDSRCVVLTDDENIANEILNEILIQTVSAKREDLIKKSLFSNGVLCVCKDIDECCMLSDIFAPEHLELQTRNPWDLVDKVKNAGTIMVGEFTPVPVCDFAAGPNHTLPTSGTSRFTSALSVDDYVKKSGLLSFTFDGLSNISKTALKIAEAEGFEAHGKTIRVRIEK